MRKNKNVLFTLLVFGLLLNSVLITLPVQTTRQSKALYPTADSHVWSEGPDGNSGRAWNLFVEGNGEEILAFLKFDLSEIPSNATIEDAKLRLFTGDVSTEASVGVHYCASNDWTEDGITYNNKPAFSPNPIDTVNVSSEWTWYEWNVTDTVQSALGTSDKRLTLVVKVKADTRGSMEFRSRNDPYSNSPYTDDHRPHLAVFYEAPPPSDNNSNLTTIAVIAVIGAAIVALELGYIRLRRRKPPANTEKDTITHTSEKKVDGSWEKNWKRN